MNGTNFGQGTVSAQQLFVFAVVAVVLLGIYNLIANAIKNHNSLKRERENPVVDLQKKYEQIDGRVRTLENKSNDLSEGQKAIVTGVNALLEHELHNGNTEQMQAASDGLINYLIGR